MAQLLIIDDNKAHAQAFKRALSISMKAFEVTIGDVSQVTNKEWKVFNDKDIIFINAKLKLEGTDKQEDFIGLSLAGQIRYDGRIGLETPIIIMSIENKDILEKRTNLSISEQDGFYYLNNPLSLMELGKIIRKAKKTSIPPERKKSELRKLNIDRAIEIIRTANHDSRNASLLVKNALKTLLSQSREQRIESLDQLISNVRRNNGGWFKWLEDNITLFPVKLQELGFNSTEEFPGEMKRINQSMETIRKYLILFHIGEDKSEIKPNDEVCMARDVEDVLNAFQEISGNLQQIRMHFEEEKND